MIIYFVLTSRSSVGCVDVVNMTKNKMYIFTSTSIRIHNHNVYINKYHHKYLKKNCEMGSVTPVNPIKSLSQEPLVVLQI